MIDYSRERMPNDSDSNDNESQSQKNFNLKESLLWRSSLDFMQHPGNVLLISSIPFCIGGYIGYKKPLEKLETLVGAKETPTGQDLESLAERRRFGVQIAARALRLATLGTVGTFGILGASKLL